MELEELQDVINIDVINAKTPVNGEGDTQEKRQHTDSWTISNNWLVLLCRVP